jgi:hypothetical protein
VWGYIPLASNERILAVWRRIRGALDKDLGIAFVLTNGDTRRTVIAGTEGTRYLSNIKWTLIDVPFGMPVRLFMIGIQQASDSSYSPHLSLVRQRAIFPSGCFSPPIHNVVKALSGPRAPCTV